MTTTQQRSTNGHIVDPTKNVMALVAAMAKSESDLREADNRYYDLAMNDMKALNTFRFKSQKEIADLRAVYNRDIRTSDLAVSAQTRLVDVQASDSKAASLATAVQALAATTDRNAETLRLAVANSAATLAKQVSDAALATASQTQAANSAMEKRLSDLEKTQNLGAGRQSVSDPQMDRLAVLVEALAKSQVAMQSSIIGESKGASNLWGYIAGGVGVLFMVIGGFAAAVSFVATRFPAP